MKIMDDDKEKGGPHDYVDKVKQRMDAIPKEAKRYKTRNRTE